MTVSATGLASDGLVYLTMTGVDAAGRTIIAQGSGVLLSGDEVLTAAHLVYDDDGALRTSGTVAVGYTDGAYAETAQVDGVQVGAKQDYTSLAGVGSDFAVVHLSTKIADGTVFSVGSSLVQGTFSVSGYPAGTAGALDTRSEVLSLLSGAAVYAGGALDDGSGDPKGSSGGSIYRVVNGKPTAYGVISADLASDVSQGYFKAFTSDDVAQIRSWVTGADSVGAVQTNSAAIAEASGSAAEPSAPGFSMDVAMALSSDAAAASGPRAGLMADVATAIAVACGQGGTFTDMMEDARGYLARNATLPSRAVAYLAGFLSGMTDVGSADIQQSADAIIEGAVTTPTQRIAAGSGRREGLGMALSNTSALAGASAGWGSFDDMGLTHHPDPGTPHAALTAGSFMGR